MSKPIEISRNQWNKLLLQLEKEYRPSDFLIRERMKVKLGFLPREYKDWDNFGGPNRTGGWRKNCIMLDFYSEKKRTWFMMKYSDFIQPEVVKNDF
jgi:hypothetical protein